MDVLNRTAPSNKQLFLPTSFEGPAYAEWWIADWFGLSPYHAKTICVLAQIGGADQ